MATTKSSKSSKSKISKTAKTRGTSRRRRSRRGPLYTVVGVILFIIALAWFFGGKPRVEFGTEGRVVTLIQTEEPLFYVVFPQLNPHANYDGNLDGGLKNADNVSSDVAGEAEGADSVAEDTGEKTKPSESNEGTAAQTKPDASTEDSASQTGSGKKTSSNKGTQGSFKGDLGHAENNPLFLGNPTDALGELSSDQNYLMVKPQFTLSYNTKTLCPNWVSWHLQSSDIGSADRSDDFRADEELPEEWYGVKKSDYQYNAYGFDRGHVCPSADRTATKEDNSMTFLMTNMVPQSPDNNRVIWMHFENYERTLVAQGNEVYIIAGPYGTGGTSSKGTFDSIPVKTKGGEEMQMNVPAYTWKVLLAIPEGEDDLSRLDETAVAIAINVPNKMGMGKTGDWEQFICSIDEIESLTGYDFFELLPDDVEDELESRVYEYSK